MLMCISLEYVDDIQRMNNRPMSLPKAEAEGDISKQDIEILKQATGADRTQHI